MMSDLELGLWLLSQQERNMLKRYFQHYWQEYGDTQERQTQNEPLCPDRKSATRAVTWHAHNRPFKQRNLL